MRGCALACAVAAVFLAGLPGASRAQIVRGTVRASNTLLPLERAQITARDSVGQMLAVVTSGLAGDYAFRMPARVPFSVEVRRLGYAMGSTTVEPLLPADTAVLEFIMTEVAAMAEAVQVTAEPGMNDRRLAEAHRRGWKVYEPELVIQHRERTPNFFQFLRTLGTPGLILPRNINDCVRSTRNNRCLTYIVDGQVLGPSANIVPNDIYFLAVLSATQSNVQFGDRAPWGALYIITRSSLDRVQPPRADGRPARGSAPPPRRPPR